MGFFDKLNDAAKKATSVAETYTQKAQNALSSATALKPVGTEDASPQQSMYILNPQSMIAPLSISASIEDLEQKKLEPIVGKQRQFSLDGKTLEIPASFDIFNSYRLAFRDLAIKCIAKAEAEYAEKIHDFITFVEIFPRIYDTNLYPLIKRAIDIFVLESIWTETIESFSLKHKARAHLAADAYDKVIQAATSTVEVNQQISSEIVSATTGLLENHIRRKYSFGAELFSSFAKGAQEGAVKNTGISPEQQIKLYQSIDVENLMNLVYVDYMGVAVSVIYILAEKNDREIWCPKPGAMEQANTIFQNLSNPNFPQDKVIDAFFKILHMQPYNIEFYKFLISRFGETEETKAILNYYGYIDFNNPRIS